MVVSDLCQQFGDPDEREVELAAERQGVRDDRVGQLVLDTAARIVSDQAFESVKPFMHGPSISDIGYGHQSVNISPVHNGISD